MELITARWASYENSRRWLIYIFILFLSRMDIRSIVICKLNCLAQWEFDKALELKRYFPSN